ncbi:hypothetical protein BX070DRAFT_96829 [Coemansia spiralis]|nr:hypothetical protein BX070DRAFT_96829 [Coemansia spiralis]
MQIDEIDKGVILEPANRTLPIRTYKDHSSKKRTPEGYTYRRCYRFIKPYINKRKVVASIGVPLHDRINYSSMASENNTGDVEDIDNVSDSDKSDLANSSSEDEVTNIESSKDRDDIKYLLSMPQVQIGVLASLPIDTQVFRLIALSGSHGIVTRALMFFIPSLSFKYVTRVLSRLESIGRERRKRYFANHLALPLISLLTEDYTKFEEASVEPGEQCVVGAVANQPYAQVETEPHLNEGLSRVDSDISVIDVENPASDSDIAEQTDAATDLANDAKKIPVSAETREAMNATYGSIQEIIKESVRRKVAVNAIVRERIILDMVEKESVIHCSLDVVRKCKELVREYILANRSLPGVTESLVRDAREHILDKRTFMRSITNLAGQKKLWYQSILPASRVGSKNKPTMYHIAIARSVDPNGPFVDMFINALNDQRKIHLRSIPGKIRRIEDVVDIPRTHGAEERDRSYNSWIDESMNLRVTRAAEAHRKAAINSTKVDTPRSKRHKASTKDGMSSRSARVQARALDPGDDFDSIWPRIAKRLGHIPSRIGRLVDLYTYLVEHLSNQVDDVYVFNNNSFRSSYLFFYLPLELFLEVTGGVSSIPEARYYIRYGTLPTRASLEDSDTESVSCYDCGQSETQSTLEEINARLATPINKLPLELQKVIDSHATRTRTHIHNLVYSLYILQLIRPVTNAKNILSMPPPPDAKDAFKDLPIESRKILSFGYQLIGKARLLNKEGYMQALEHCKAGSSKAVDLTQCYLNDDVYDIHEPLGLFKYFGALELSCRSVCHELPLGHPLYGIGFSNYWHRHVVILSSQAEALGRFVNQSTLSTPLDEFKLLKTAAEKAGTTLDEARRYYQQMFTRMCQIENRRNRDLKKQQEKIRARIEAAKKRELEKAKMKREREHAATAAAATTAAKSAVTKKKRMFWANEETRKVAMFMAILRTHAREHDHPFLVKGTTEVFPSREKIARPSESVRQHWLRIQRVSEHKVFGEQLNTVWKYLLRDAVAKGHLIDNPDIDQFDVKSAVDYFGEQLESQPIGYLLEQYADDIAEDATLEPLISTNMQSRAYRASAIEEEDAAGTKQGTTKPRGKRVDRLPATMKNDESNYMIDSDKFKTNGAPIYEFLEDSYTDAILRNKRKLLSGSVMLTTHSGWSNIMDYSSPITTYLSISTKQPDSDNMDIDHSNDSLQTSSKVEVVTQAAEHPSYPDTLGYLHPVERTLDIGDITKQIGKLALDDYNDNSDISDNSGKGNAGTTDESRADASSTRDAPAEQCYAELASLQAMVVNLMLTPDNEYDVATGQALLSAKRRKATDVFYALYRNMVINRLRGMAASIGLGDLVRSDKIEESAADLDLDTPTVTGENGTIVLHETTGVSRVSTRAATSGKGISQDDMGADSNLDALPAQKHMVDSSIVSMLAYERRVPGRGYAISDKFLNAIKPALSEDFVCSHWKRKRNSATLEMPLSSGELWEMCRLIAEGKLWLRPKYNLPSDKHFSGMAGFKGHGNIDNIEFEIDVAVDDSDNAGSVDLLSKESTLNDQRQHAISAIGLSPELLELVARIVIGVIETMGPLGANAYELSSLFAILTRNGNDGAAAVTFLPDEVLEMLQSARRTNALLQMLAIDSKLYTVGSSDVRYVSVSMYEKSWSITLGNPVNRTFIPHIGQSLGGSTITTYTLGVLSSLVCHIFENPSISQATLMRRFYAPYIPKAEIAHYLDVLARLGVVDVETVDRDGLTTSYLQTGLPGSITYYSMADGFHRRVSSLDSCYAATNIQFV